MGLQLSGEVLEVRTRTVTPKPGQTWQPFTERQVTIGTEDFRREYVTLSKDLGDVQFTEGEHVTLSVFCGAYVNGAGKARTQMTATAVVAAEGARKASSAA